MKTETDISRVTITRGKTVTTVYEGNDRDAALDIYDACILLADGAENSYEWDGQLIAWVRGNRAEVRIVCPAN